MSTHEPSPGGPDQNPYQTQPTPQPGYGAAWTPPPTAPKKPRPSAWWFLGPVALVAAAVAVFVVALVAGFSGLVTDTQSLPADGQPHQVTLKNTEKQMLAIDEDEFWTADCTVTDAGSGEQLTINSPTGDVTVNGWEVTKTFRPISPDVVVTCQPGTSDPADPSAGAGTEVIVGEAPEIGRAVGGIIVATIVPLVLGSIAVIWAIVLGILMAVRGPRRPRNAV